MIRTSAFLVLLLLTGCGREAALDRLAPGERGRVAEVISGHYVELESGLGVRLVGLIAPKDDDPHAAESEALLRRLVDGRQVQLLYGGRRRDDYDRALAHLKVEGKGLWVQRAMLEAGAARVNSWPDNRALVGEMLEAEAKARNAGKGLWALPAYAVRLPREADPGEFQIIEGRVRRVSEAGEGRALEFDAEFSAYVSPRDVPDFDQAGKSAASFAGKLIRIRGYVRDGYDGPELRLTHPEQVEVLERRR
ncbi:MAG TPA: thermonuclease family protein [Caulobacteraceae bacterium]